MELKLNRKVFYKVTYLSKSDMAHLTDAVSWWNSIRHYGAKSKEVRKWMLDSVNYELDHFSLNRLAGAKLSERYLPPTKK
ncbi:HNH/ENDO VII family nuclease [Bacillus cereus]|nr:HNH/ENDO VII family nuclease [Bacillus cereus]